MVVGTGPEGVVLLTRHLQHERRYTCGAVRHRYLEIVFLAKYTRFRLLRVLSERGTRYKQL